LHSGGPGNFTSAAPLQYVGLGSESLPQTEVMQAKSKLPIILEIKQ